MTLLHSDPLTHTKIVVISLIGAILSLWLIIAAHPAPQLGASITHSIAVSRVSKVDRTGKGDRLTAVVASRKVNIPIGCDSAVSSLVRLARSDNPIVRCQT
jgi:hypothetical protein